MTTCTRCQSEFDTIPCGPRGEAWCMSCWWEVGPKATSSPGQAFVSCAQCDELIDEGKSHYQTRNGELLHERCAAGWCRDEIDTMTDDELLELLRVYAVEKVGR